MFRWQFFSFFAFCEEKTSEATKAFAFPPDLREWSPAGRARSDDFVCRDSVFYAHAVSI
jgi:hypothetical protein